MVVSFFSMINYLLSSLSLFVLLSVTIIILTYTKKKTQKIEATEQAKSRELAKDKFVVQTECGC